VKLNMDGRFMGDPVLRLFNILPRVSPYHPPGFSNNWFLSDTGKKCILWNTN